MTAQKHNPNTFQHPPCVHIALHQGEASFRVDVLSGVHTHDGHYRFDALLAWPHDAAPFRLYGAPLLLRAEAGLAWDVVLQKSVFEAEHPHQLRVFLNAPRKHVFMPNSIKSQDYRVFLGV